MNRIRAAAKAVAGLVLPIVGVIVYQLLQRGNLEGMTSSEWLWLLLLGVGTGLGVYGVPNRPQPARGPA